MTWTPERIETLIKLWMSGKSATEIARHFGDMGRNSVIGKVHRLKLDRAPPEAVRRVIPWSADEDATLRRLHDEGKTARQMLDDLPRRTITGIRDRRVKLGMAHEAKGGWTQAEIDTLRKMTLAGDSVMAVCEALPGRSYDSVTKRRAILGLKVSKFVRVRKAIANAAANPPKPKPAPRTSNNKGIGEAVRRLNAFTCRYPHGDPKIEGFYFCCEPIKIGRIYCDEHRAKCFVS